MPFGNSVCTTPTKLKLQRAFDGIVALQARPAGHGLTPRAGTTTRGSLPAHAATHLPVEAPHQFIFLPLTQPVCAPLQRQPQGLQQIEPFDTAHP